MKPVHYKRLARLIDAFAMLSMIAAVGMILILLLFVVAFPLLGFFGAGLVWGVLIMAGIAAASFVTCGGCALLARRLRMAAACVGRCPSCGYSLRGRESAVQCPECGLEF